MGRRLAVGDIHGRFGLLQEALEKASFDRNSDTLYSVGDLADRGEESLATLRFLHDLPSFRPVLGNHDAWLEQWLVTGRADWLWLEYNGGRRTVEDFRHSGVSEEEKKALGAWLSTFPLVRIEEDIIIAHAGLPEDMDEGELAEFSRKQRKSPVNDHLGHVEEWLLWDRTMLENAKKGRVECAFRTEKTVFIGHTQQWKTGKPYINQDFHLVCLDTGAGSGRGPVTVMDIDSGEVYASSVKALFES